jgi:hypothetical protein
MVVRVSWVASMEKGILQREMSPDPATAHRSVSISAEPPLRPQAHRQHCRKILRTTCWFQCSPSPGKGSR